MKSNKKLKAYLLRLLTKKKNLTFKKHYELTGKTLYITGTNIQNYTGESALTFLRDSTNVTGTSSGITSMQVPNPNSEQQQHPEIPDSKVK